MDSGTITLSLVTYNQAGLLELFLKNYLTISTDSRFPNLFIIDDGSFDNTNNLLKHYSDTNPKITFQSGDHKGIAAARNLALEKCPTKWIAFTDTDCKIDRSYLEELNRIPDEYPDCIAVEGRVTADPFHYQAGYNHFAENQFGGSYITANMVFNVKKVIDSGGFRESFENFREDVDLGLKLRNIHSIPFNKKLNVVHPRIKKNLFKSLVHTWKNSGNILKSEKLLYQYHPHDYSSVRHFKTAAQTVFHWRKFHLAGVLKSYLKNCYQEISQGNFSLRDWLKFPFYFVRDIIKWFLTGLWEQSCYLLRGILDPQTEIPSLTRPDIMLVWTGGVVENYHPLFENISMYANVIVVSPKQWKHGSYFFKKETHNKKFSLKSTLFWPTGSSHYIIPLLPFYLLRNKPAYLYWMDELDRVTTLFHIIMAKVFSPGSKVVTYSLQNLEHPAYYKWHHRLALKFNLALVYKAIAASPDAEKVMRRHGIKKPVKIIPLGVSSQHFYPGNKLQLRQLHNFDESALILIYAGSLAMEKGIFNVARHLQANPEIKMIIVGSGPLENTIKALDNKNIFIQPAISPSELLEYYQLSDYVILPSRNSSRWIEQIGRTLLEGILCGCTAVGSFSGYIPAITLDKETQFDPESTESIRIFLKSLPLPHNSNIYKRQLNNVRKNYLWPVIAESTFEFITE